MAHARFRSLARSRSSLLLCALLTSACGGGGGGGSDAPSGTPTPRPSPVLPITPPGAPSSSAQIILRDGDQLPGGLIIGNIEDASLGAGGRAAVLISVSESNGLGAIAVREPDGSLDTVFDPHQPGDVDPTTLSRLRMAPSGELVFQSGRGLDVDRLHVVAGGVVTTVAGAAPGPVFPDFRMLGNVRIGQGGVVAFAGGGGECEVVVGEDEPRVTCTNALYVADASVVMRLDDGELDLARQRPSAVRVEVDPAGGAWFSLPRRGDAATVLHHAGGETTVALTGEAPLPGVGVLNAVEAVAANLSGDVLLEASLRELEGDRRPQVVGVLRGEGFSLIAKEGTSLGGQNVATLRGLALDAGGRALFQAELGPIDAPGEQRSSLWYGDAGDLVEVVRERRPFPGEQNVVLELQGSRLNAAGDVAFVTELGSVEGDTVRLQEVRATVRRADGRLVTVASSRNTGQLGAISTLQIAGFDDEGTLLLIAARGASSDRVLLLGRSDGGD